MVVIISLKNYDTLAVFDGVNNFRFRKDFILKMGLCTEKSFVVKCLGNALILVPADYFFINESMIKRIDLWVKQQIKEDDKVLLKVLGFK